MTQAPNGENTGETPIDYMDGLRHLVSCLREELSIPIIV